MSGQLVEFPKKLVWNPVETWIGKVAGTSLWAQVTSKEDGIGYSWAAWNGPIQVCAGEAPSSEKAMLDAAEALETGVLVVRPLPQADAR